MILDDAVAPKLRSYLLGACSSPPNSGARVVGILLGWITQYCPLLVRVEGFEDIARLTRHGGHYALSDSDRTKLRDALRRGRISHYRDVVGFFRGCSGEKELEPFDKDLFAEYFPKRTDILLLLKPSWNAGCNATLRFGYESFEKPLHPFVSFSEVTRGEENAIARESLVVPASVPNSARPVLVKRSATSSPALSPAGPVLLADLDRRESFTPGRSRLAVAAFIVLSVAAYVWWAVSGPRREDHLSSRAPEHTALLKGAPAPAPIRREPPDAAPPAADTRLTPPPQAAAVAVPPAALHEAQPAIPPGVRARITGRIEIPVRVRVSSTGRVIGAVPEGGPQTDGLFRYLANQAARAALSWTFAPAKTQDGTAILSEQKISFVFTPE